MTTTVIGLMRRLDDNHGAVRVEAVYHTDVDDLWSALTDPDRLKRWIATVTGALHTGGSIYATFTSGGEGEGVIEACDPSTRLLVRMLPNTPDEQFIEANLTAEEGRTRLIIENRGLPIPELPEHGAGWQVHLEDLDRYLNGADSNWRTRWQELVPVYSAQSVEGQQVE